MKSEKRRFARTYCDFSGKVHSAGTSFPVRIKNLSLNGAFIDALVADHVGDLIDLEIIPGKAADLEPIRATARLVRKTDNGYGLHFEVVELGSYLRLDNALNRMRYNNKFIRRHIFAI